MSDQELSDETRLDLNLTPPGESQTQKEEDAGPMTDTRRPALSPIPPPTSPGKKKIPVAAKIIGGILGLVLFGAVMSHFTGGGGSDSSTFEMTGTLTLYKSTDSGSYSLPHYTSYGTTCAGTGGYSDIRSGAGVTVYDAAGNVVGSGSLDSGTVTSSGCDFDFTVPNVPNSNMYQYEISHRGRLALTPTEAHLPLGASLGD